MAHVSTNLHFPGTTKAAFDFYKSVFGGEFVNVTRFGDLPAQPGQPEMSESDKSKVMFVQLPIMGGHILQGNDIPPGMGEAVFGNTVDICLNPDTRAEADRLYAALAVGGKEDMPMADMGFVYNGSASAYYGSVIDQFGITWAITCISKA